MCSSWKAFCQYNLPKQSTSTIRANTGIGCCLHGLCYSLLFGSAYLGQENISEAAQNLSAIVTSAGLPKSVQKQALETTLQDALQDKAALPSDAMPKGVSSIPDVVSVLAAAAISAQGAAARRLQWSWRPLGQLCTDTPSPCLTVLLRLFER